MGPLCDAFRTFDWKNIAIELDIFQKSFNTKAKTLNFIKN